MTEQQEMDMSEEPWTSSKFIQRIFGRDSPFEEYDGSMVSLFEFLDSVYESAHQRMIPK